VLLPVLLSLSFVIGPAQAPVQAVVDPAVRSAFFERLLAPREGPVVAAPVPGDRTQQRAFEAAEFHRRGLVFAQQGAWREAESAFRDAERRNDRVPEYTFSAAYAYLRTHKPNDAYKRFEEFYKKDPTDIRALVGMIAAREEAQLYRDAVVLWMRYTRMPLPDALAAEAQALLLGARELFAQRYEIAENPAGGAANLATPQQELEWGLGYAKELSESGIPLLQDRTVTRYVEQLSQRLVNHAKQFPTNYQLFVLDTAGVNATTVPGFIFVYRGLLDAAPSEAALAGVLAHEIGHSVAHHTAKKVTKNYQDEQQLASLKSSDSKLSQFLAKLLEAGNPVGAMSFSRDAEAQADRLGVHIAFDAGYDPVGLTEMFQIFEQLSPSSRNSWDLLTRTHPFSIDRINAVKEYAALLPPRTFAPSSDGFAAMKARLKALPPPPDATGRLLSSSSAPTPAPTQAPPAATVKTKAYAMEPTPFSVRMPETWTTRKQSAQITVFSAPAGTPDAEASVWIRLAPTIAQPTWTISDYVRTIQEVNAKLTNIAWGEIDEQRTPDGRTILILPASWTGKTSAGAETPTRCVFIFAEFPDYMAIGQYSAPAPYFERLSTGFDIIWNSLTYGAAAPTPPPPPPPTPAPAPATSAGRITFTIEAPPFTGEMPEGWTARRQDDGLVIIEGRQGTEPYEMTIRLSFFDKTTNSLDGLLGQVNAAMAALPEAEVTRLELDATAEGRPARAIVVNYAGRDSNNRTMPFRQIVAIVEYQGVHVVIGYYGPTALYEKYIAAFEMVGTTLRERR